MLLKTNNKHQRWIKKKIEKNWWISHFLFRRLLLRVKKNCGTIDSTIQFWHLDVCLWVHITHVSFSFLFISFYALGWNGSFFYFILLFIGSRVFGCMRLFFSKLRMICLGFFTLHSFLSTHVSSFFLFYLFHSKFNFYFIYCCKKKMKRKKKQMYYDNLLCNRHQPILFV